MLFYSQTCGVKKYQSRQQAVLENGRRDWLLVLVFSFTLPRGTLEKIRKCLAF